MIRLGTIFPFSDDTTRECLKGIGLRSRVHGGPIGPTCARKRNPPDEVSERHLVYIICGKCFYIGIGINRVSFRHILTLIHFRTHVGPMGHMCTATQPNVLRTFADAYRLPQGHRAEICRDFHAMLLPGDGVVGEDAFQASSAAYCFRDMPVMAPILV